MEQIERWVWNEWLEHRWGTTWWPYGPLGTARIPRPWGFLVAEPRPLLWRGDWTLYYVRKTGTPTDSAARALAGALRAKGWAYYGLKDTNAIAYQHIALHKPKAKPPSLELLGGRVRAWLVADQVNRPRPGDHAWNAFRIILEPEGSDLRCPSGAPGPVPNYFGPQRFGVCRPNSHVVGKLLLLGDQQGLEEELSRRYPFEPPRGPDRLTPFMRRIAVQAFQAYVWNRALSRAFREGYEFAGARHARLACPRVAGELRSPLLPLPSPVRTGPEWWERLVDEVLEDEGVPRRLLRGLRPVPRPGLLWACTWRCRRLNGSVETLFALPRGAYATVLLRSVYRIDWLDECLSRSPPSAD